MIIITSALSLLALVGAALAQGAGPYPAGYFTDPSLPNETIYRPQSPPSGQKLPVLLWGNGACSANGLSNQALLTNIASYGYWVFASGCPNCSGSTTSQQMKNALAFVSSHAGQGNYSTVDSSKIAAAGFSCGGVEAYDLESDPRVQTLGIVSSGLLTNYDAARRFTKTIFYVLGGPSDIAYSNGERDYSYLPTGTPSWKGNLNVGHGGTLGDANGGRFGQVILAWLQYFYRGDQSSWTFLTGGGATSLGWQVQYKSLRAPGSTTGTATTTTTTFPSSSATTGTGECVPLYAQCGGSGYTGPKCCYQGTCKYSNEWYSQCLN